MPENGRGAAFRYETRGGLLEHFPEGVREKVYTVGKLCFQGYTKKGAAPMETRESRRAEIVYKQGLISLYVLFHDTRRGMGELGRGKMAFMQQISLFFKAEEN